MRHVRDSPGPAHRPSVTSDWRIHGVIFQSSPSVDYEEDRQLTELYRPEWVGVFGAGEPVEHLYTVHEPNGGSRKEFHYHERTLDRYMILQGLLDVGLYDSRPDSPTHGVFGIVELGEAGSGLPNALRIPPLVWHSLNWRSPSGLLLNAKLPGYNAGVPDKFRVPLDQVPDAITWDV